MLFRFVAEWSITKVLASAILLAILYRFIALNQNKIIENRILKLINRHIKIYLDYFNSNKLLLFIFSTATFYLVSASFNQNIFLTCGIAFIFYKILFNLNSNSDYPIIYISMFFLLYTNAMTGGLANWGTILSTALFIGTVFNAVGIYFSIVPVIALVIITVINIGYNKFISPYNFWGSVQTSIFFKQKELPYEALKGIYTGIDTHELYVGIKSAIEGHSKDINDIYLYPNIPIFYYLHNKLPPTRVLGQWFDFINKKQVDNELSYLKTNQPHLIILFDPPPNVYHGHQSMIGRPLGQRDIINLLDRYVSDGQYKIIEQKLFCSEFILMEDYKRGQNKLNKIEFIIRNNLPSSYSIKNLVNDFPGVEVYSFTNMKKGIQTTQINLNYNLHLGDRITLGVNDENINNLLGLFGDYNKSARNIGIDSCYSLKVLKSNG